MSLRHFKNDFANECTDYLWSQIKQLISSSDRITDSRKLHIGISGGSVLNILTSNCPLSKEELKSIIFFAVDERMVPLDDVLSNIGMFSSRLNQINCLKPNFIDKSNFDLIILQVILNTYF